jgi:hypothetical protein
MLEDKHMEGEFKFHFEVQVERFCFAFYIGSILIKIRIFDYNQLWWGFFVFIEIKVSICDFCYNLIWCWHM